MNPKCPMKPKEKMTEDETYRHNYVKLIIKALKHCTHYSPDSISLFPEDKNVIEYHLRNVARHAVVEDTSTEDCVALFKTRIERLVTGNSEAWTGTLEFVRRHQLLLSQEEIKQMNTMFHQFRKHATPA